MKKIERGRKNVVLLIVCMTLAIAVMLYVFWRMYLQTQGWVIEGISRMKATLWLMATVLWGLSMCFYNVTWQYYSEWLFRITRIAIMSLIFAGFIISMYEANEWISFSIDKNGIKFLTFDLLRLCFFDV